MSPLSNYYRIGTLGERVDGHGARAGVVVTNKSLEELFFVAAGLNFNEKMNALQRGLSRRKIHRLTF